MVCELLYTALYTIKETQENNVTAYYIYIYLFFLEFCLWSFRL